METEGNPRGGRAMSGLRLVAVGCVFLAVVLVSMQGLSPDGPVVHPQAHTISDGNPIPAVGNATTNLTSSLNRLVILASLAAGAVVSLAWVRVALSWFSTDPSKKITAKDRARDAMLGTFILLAAVTGLAWGLANWVLTGA